MLETLSTVEFRRLACLALALPGPLVSQEPDSGDAEALAPTIVEAERVEDDPAAVSVLSRASLDQFQSESFADLSGLVPGFHVIAADSRGLGSVVAMRGSTNTLFFGPPSLGLTIDDLPLGDAFTYPSELLDFSEIRVHRGPHGPYFGRNAPAGMVEMFTPAPAATPRHELETEYGSYDRFALRGRSSGPIGEGFSYSARVFHDRRDGFIRNPTLGTETDDRRATGGLFNIYWNPDGETELRFRLFAERIDDGSQRLSSLFSPDPFTVFSDRPGVTEIERYQLSLHSRKTLAAGTFETIHGYQFWDLDPSTVDLDLSFPSAANGFADSTSTIRQQQDLVSNEFRFTSADHGALSWRAGFFQMWIDNRGTTERQLFPGFVETTAFDIEQLNFAAYGNLSWRASDFLALDAGLRLDHHRSEIDRTRRDPLPGDNPVRGEESEWFVSPTLGATYAVSPAVDLFYRTGLGHKPAGFTAFADSPALARFDRETNWSNEIGFEYRDPDRDLRFGLRAFWDRIDDYHLNQSVPGSTNFVILNADEVVSRGIEFDTAWVPVEGLTLRSSIGYVDAEFDSFTDPLSGAALDGRKVPFVPEYTGSAGIRYDFESGFYTQTSVRAAGRTRFDSANTGGFTEDAHLTWDAEIGYRTEHLAVAVYGRNLLDEHYNTFINPQVFARSPGDPQQFGVRVTTTF